MLLVCSKGPKPWAHIRSQWCIQVVKRTPSSNIDVLLCECPNQLRCSNGIHWSLARCLPFNLCWLGFNFLSNPEERNQTWGPRGRWRIHSFGAALSANASLRKPRSGCEEASRPQTRDSVREAERKICCRSDRMNQSPNSGALPSQTPPHSLFMETILSSSHHLYHQCCWAWLMETPIHGPPYVEVPWMGVFRAHR